MPDARLDLQHVLTEEWSVDRGSATPIHAQIRDRLAQLITQDVLRAGDRVPSERTLAQWLGVSRVTARAALDGLAEHKAVRRGTGRTGTLVAARVSHDLARFSGFTEIVRRQGREVATRILSLTTEPATGGAATALGFSNGEQVHRLRRLRMITDEPSTIEDTCLPATFFPDLLAHDMRGSVYAVLAAVYDRLPARAVERISAVAASAEEARLLEIDDGDPLLRLERVAFDAAELAMEYSIDLHRTDQIDFVVSSEAAHG